MKFQWPIDKKYRWISGYDFDPPPNGNHGAQDFGTPNGANYYAPQDGIVKTARFTLDINDNDCSKGYGNYIEIDHGDGWITLGAHLLEGYVKAGDSVKMGQLIGKTNNTGCSSGPHIHFVIKHNGTPLKPTEYLYDLVEPTPEPEPIPTPEFPQSPTAVSIYDSLRVRSFPSTANHAKVLYYLQEGDEIEVIRLVQSGKSQWAKIGNKEFVAFFHESKYYLKWKTAK